MITRSKLIRGTALAACWVALGLAAPAVANAADPTLEAAVAAMPHSAPVYNGVPVQVGTGRDGKPRFEYQGAGSGNLSPGIPNAVLSRRWWENGVA
jgi:hypothetical protein